MSEPGMVALVSDFYASGRFVDAVLLLMLIEGVALIAYERVTGRGVAPTALIANLVAGGALLLALRAALSGWGTPAVASCLALSFAAHIADLHRRWKS